MRAQSGAGGNGKVRATGSFVVPPDVRGTPPVKVEVKDSAGHDGHLLELHGPVARAHTVQERDSSVRFSPTSGGACFRAKLKDLAINAPFAGPVTVTIMHDGATRAGVISTRDPTATGIRCRS